MARQKKDNSGSYERLTITLPKELLGQLRKWCLQEDIPISCEVRRAIRERLGDN